MWLKGQHQHPFPGDKDELLKRLTQLSGDELSAASPRNSIEPFGDGLCAHSGPEMIRLAQNLKVALVDAQHQVLNVQKAQNYVQIITEVTSSSECSYTAL